ncbi:MAG: S9 family peptidase [Candidatus Marinimicrobia bacterium]|nr:S9 family peptidase [Candidatus Neomarinimicrobiota bacterium]MDP7336410.1 S9 family peptidase [Candidatus Neomarinimicrobiota bacterium]
MNFKKFKIIILLCCFNAVFADQNTNKITVEWINSEEAKAVAQVYRYQWVEDNTAILYDLRLLREDRTFLMLDPERPEEILPIIDVDKALKSLEESLDEPDTVRTLDWPLSFDNAGQKALYLFKKDIFILELESSSFLQITHTKTKEKSPRFSPDGSKIAFVRDNDLYVYDLNKKREKRITRDGSETILNGTLSWVYWEEIFGRRDIGYWWSDDSEALVFLRTDESPVTKMHYVDFRPQEPRLITQRYPKTGTENPIVKVGVVNVDYPRVKWARLDPYEYICRVKWIPDSKRFSLQTMDRAQTELNLYYMDRKNGKNLGKVLTEKDEAWVNINDDLYFMENGQFLWQSERNGFAHMYRFEESGALVNQVTKGNWALRSSGGPFWLRQSVVNLDEENGLIYFTAMKKSSIERHLYRAELNGDGLTRLTKNDGVHKVGFSPNGKYFINKHSTINTLPSLSLYQKDGTLVKTLANPRPELIEGLNIQTPELFTISTSDGFQMPAQILKPADFDPKKKYPLIYHIYGGPSAPTVYNQWQGASLFFDNMLVERGYIIVRFDHRSSTGISKNLENRLNLLISGPREMEDIVDGIKWLKSQSYIDPNRVGIWGWSGGGSFTLNAMTNTKEFKAGISGAPVTDWHYYDTKWGEFAMKRPQDNPEGYDLTSLVKSAKNLHGRLLLIHGTYDDNVHPQNSWHFIDELIKANIMFDMMFYPMRMHGFSDKPAKIHRQNKMIEFWLKNL